MNFEHFKGLRDAAIARCTQDGGQYPAPEAVPPLLLALVGDAVFSLYVRTRLLPASTQVRVVHTLAARMVSAVMQARALTMLQDEDYFTDEEQGVLRRGRNAKSLAPKSASVQEYRLSTAWEALAGYLLLSARYERLQDYLERSFTCIAAAMQEQATEKS